MQFEDREKITDGVTDGVTRTLGDKIDAVVIITMWRDDEVSVATQIAYDLLTVEGRKRALMKIIEETSGAANDFVNYLLSEIAKAEPDV